MSTMALTSLFSPGRLGAVLAKEFVQMRRDRITFAMMLVVPIVQLLLFGYAINNDPKGLPAAVLALGQDRYTRSVVAALEVSGYYRFAKRPESAAEAESLMARGAISFLVTIPSDFGMRVERGDEPRILVEADATDPAASSNAVGALQTIASRALTRALGTDELKREQSESALSFVVHRRYNPEGITQYNIVPGLLGVILQMTMVMMTAMALTREIERGTMENLLAMPATPGEIMLGKVLPYLAVGSVQVAVVLSAAKLLFGVPFLGSLGLLLTCVTIFVLALVLLGYTISTMARTQLQAMQLTFFFFLPSLLLSGFMFPYAGMPLWAQWLGEIFPLTHFLRVVRAIMLKGADLGDIGLEVFYLSIFVPLYAGIALLRFRSTLD
jgi:ABC-2 type transport system permease protein